LPELPDARRRRFTEAYSLGEDEARQLTSSREIAEYFEAVVEACGGDAHLAATWLMGEVSAALNRDGIELDACPVPAASIGALLRRIADGTLSGKLAKQVFEAMWAGEGEPDAIIDARGLRQVTDSDEIGRLVGKVIASNPDQVEQYRSGKTKVIGFLVGQVMKASSGKANPQQVNTLLRQRLDG
jgi:aspartyl-tRNA(Asn)/glutamyl-tRNA(Gln) amidotransferase subunit B